MTSRSVSKKPRRSNSLARKIQVGIIAPSAKVPQIELNLGVDKIQASGFDVRVHPFCERSFLFFAGTDEERSASFLEFAKDPNIAIIWCARGGSGAIRLLPQLDRRKSLIKKSGKKLLVGYSDSTVLMEYARKNWGWSILHAPMPSMRKFSVLERADWVVLEKWLRREPAQAPWQGQTLQFWSSTPKKGIQGTLLGGNLTVWNGLAGTPYEPRPGKSMLFFEDIDESLYRIDRMVQQQILSGAWDRVQGIVLGNFLNCRDYAPLVLKAKPTSTELTRVLSDPKPEELQPLRPVIEAVDGLRKIWTDVAARLKIPVAYGLPVGHGPEVSPLPLGAQYRLHPSGQLELVTWDWLES